uniref:Bulb-type lectin domain-containing protein n=1 Tax=Corethron hystrix TaxID=216773 RepID=A0A7S1C257_9STRA
MAFEVTYHQQGRWSMAEEVEPAFSKHGDVMFLGAGGAKMHAFQRNNQGEFQGEPTWTTQLDMWDGDPTEPIPYTPTLNHHYSILYVTSPSSSFSALNFTNGTLLWTYYSDASSSFGPVLLSPDGTSIYTVERETGTVIALDALWGDLLWTHRTSGMYDVEAPPLLSPDGRMLSVTDIFGTVAEIYVDDAIQTLAPSVRPTVTPQPTMGPTSDPTPEPTHPTPSPSHVPSVAPTVTAAPSALLKVEMYPFALHLWFEITDDTHGENGDEIVDTNSWGNMQQPKNVIDLSELIETTERHLSSYLMNYTEGSLLYVMLQNTAARTQHLSRRNLLWTENATQEENLVTLHRITVEFNASATFRPSLPFSVEGLGLGTTAAFAGGDVPYGDGGDVTSPGRAYLRALQTSGGGASPLSSKRNRSSSVPCTESP